MALIFTSFLCLTCSSCSAAVDHTLCPSSAVQQASNQFPTLTLKGGRRGDGKVLEHSRTCRKGASLPECSRHLESCSRWPPQRQDPSDARGLEQTHQEELSTRSSAHFWCFDDKSLLPCRHLEDDEGPPALPSSYLGSYLFEVSIIF